MKKIVLFLTLFIILGFGNNLKAQSLDTIAGLLEKIRNETDINTRIKLGKTTDSIFYSLAKNIDLSSKYPQSLLKYTSRLIAKDKRLVIVTWNVFLDNGEYHYYGYIQYKSKDGKILTYHLIDKSDEINNPETSNMSIDRWYGCLYYQIIEQKAGRKRIYTLLGWDGNNYLSQKKIIEVLSFQNDRPKFGYRFDIDGKIKKRIVFEYNKQVEMNLRWDEKRKMIIWDHLSPSEPKFEGMYQFYGPDFSYDGLVFRKKRWIYLKNVQVKNPKPEIDKK